MDTILYSLVNRKCITKSIHSDVFCVMFETFKSGGGGKGVKNSSKKGNNVI